MWSSLNQFQARREPGTKMATNTHDLPPYVRVATVYGVVALRRTVSGLWAGRGLRKLECAKRGFLSEEKEIMEWREVKNSCVICSKPSTLTVLWEGPGSEKPIKPQGMRNEFRTMHYKPVKIMDAYVCGICRITVLSRVVILTQWDLRGTKMETAECSCQWDGTYIHYCNSCSLLFRAGRLLQVGRAKGWQVRRYVDPLKAFSPMIGDGAWSAAATPRGTPRGNEGDGQQEHAYAGPSAPAHYPTLCAAELEGYRMMPREDRGRRSLLEEAISQAWPYDPQYGQAASPPFNTNQVPLVLRVFRDPATPGYTTGLEKLPDDVREKAKENGWEGPWELTTWGKLIEEVVTDSSIQTEELPDVPKEEGARGTNLYYSVTGLDAWGSSGAKAKAKNKEFYVTPEGWYRNGEMQLPGMVASRVATPIRPEQTVKVRVTAQMIVIPFKGVYSVGADITLIEEAQPEESEEEPKEKSTVKRLGSWLRRPFTGKPKTTPQPGN